MNIIAFVIGIMMIFAITTSTLAKKSLSDNFISKSFCGYMASSRKALNEYENYRFNQIKEKPQINSNSNNNEKKIQADKTKPRKIDTDNAKVNIYALVLDKKENQKELYNLLASLIKTLYINQSFYKKGFEYDILENILSAFENQINKKEDLNFETLVLKDNSLKNIYYKIIKGTKFYDFAKKIGTPSLLDFVKVENSNLKIPMKDASKELLVSLFDEKITDEINALQIQKPPNHLTYEKILSLCHNRRIYPDEKILKFFDFSNTVRRSQEKIFVGLDKNTDIKVKIKIPIS